MACTFLFKNFNCIKWSELLFFFHIIHNHPSVGFCNCYFNRLSLCSEDVCAVWRFLMVMNLYPFTLLFFTNSTFRECDLSKISHSIFPGNFVVSCPVTIQIVLPSWQITNIFQPCGFKLGQDLKCVLICFFLKVCLYCLVHGNTVLYLNMVSYCTFIQREYIQGVYVFKIRIFSSALSCFFPQCIKNQIYDQLLIIPFYLQW